MSAERVKKKKRAVAAKKNAAAKRRSASGPTSAGGIASARKASAGRTASARKASAGGTASTRKASAGRAKTGRAKAGRANYEAASETKAASLRQSRFPFLFGEGGIDTLFLLIVAVLLTVGLVMLFTSSYTYCYYNFKGDSFYYLKRQLVFAVLGVIAMLAVSKLNYRLFKKAALPLLFISTFLLIIVLFLPPPEGFEDFHRWISIPGLGSFQPSEISKLAIILFFARHMDKNYAAINNGELSHAKFAAGYNSSPGPLKIRERHTALLLYLCVLGLTCMLVYAENHVSGTLLILALGIMMLWLAGFSEKAFIILIALGAAAVFLVISKPDILPSHAQPRIEAWLNKDFEPLGARWQTNNALYAIGSGGFFGVGIGNSKQKQLYVSEPQNDFIFSIVCEELGFVGALLIIGLFIALLCRGFMIALRCRDKFGSLLAMGIVLQVALQAALNIGVVTDILPNTGISLPFFSYGGTSLTMLLIQMGMVLSVSRYSNVRKF